MTHHSLRILVVDDDRSMAKTLTDIIRVTGHQAEMAHSSPDALDRLKAQSFDCVLSDIRMPGMDGVALYRAIKKLRPDLPMVLMTAYSTDDVIQEGLAEGVVATLTKPLDIDALLRFFSYLHRAQSVAIVNDDPAFCRTLSDLLRVRGFAVAYICDPEKALNRLEQSYDVLLLDMKLDNIDGLALLRSIKAQHPRKEVILVTGYRQKMAASIQIALEVGAHTCLYKPLQIEELLQTLAAIRRREMNRILTR